MVTLESPLVIGPLTLANRIVYSPLAGCSDYPFRKMSVKYRPGLVFCEMVKMDALVRHDDNTFRLLDYDGEMHPIGAQLCGSNPKLVQTASRLIEDLGFDVVDLNCGCPVDKVTKDGSGSALLKSPEKIGELLHLMVQAVSIPVMVKIRAGWDENSINAPLIVQIAEAAGASAIAIHGRTREQAYRGPANWGYIAEAARAKRTIKVLGNGDLLDRESAYRMQKETGCDGFLVSRGTLGKPWVVREMLGQKGGNLKEDLLEHYHLIAAYEPERVAVLSLRRVACWYLREKEQAKKLREGINRAQTLEEIRELIETWN